jgi:hypothetical protein
MWYNSEFDFLSAIYKTIILRVDLKGCETWSFTLREEHRFRVFENRKLRRVFGPNRDEVTGGRRKLHDEELHHLYSPPNMRLFFLFNWRYSPIMGPSPPRIFWFPNLFRHMVGLLGRVISPSQGLYLYRTTQHRKTRTNVHALSGIRTRDPVYEKPRPAPQTAWPLDRQILDY